jgi:hypothetical protein
MIWGASAKGVWQDPGRRTPQDRHGGAMNQRRERPPRRAECRAVVPLHKKATRT